MISDRHCIDVAAAASATLTAIGAAQKSMHAQRENHEKSEN